MTRDELETMIEQTADNLSRIVNAGDYRDLQKFAELMMRDHRTLVQSKMSLFCALWNCWTRRTKTTCTIFVMKHHASWLRRL